MQSPSRTSSLPLAGLVALALAGAACEPVDAPPPPPGGDCPAELPLAATRCADPSCAATDTATRTHAQADLSAARSKAWLVVTALTSEVFDNENVDVTYGKGSRGALSPRRARPSRRDGASPRASARVEAERRVRAESVGGPVDLSRTRGTAVRGRTAEWLPAGARRQAMACSATAAACGPASLCVIPAGETAGTCESALTLKWRAPGAQGTTPLEATVRRVGTHAAIAVEDGVELSDADVQALLSRFDEHVAPLVHGFFGQPRDAQGRDRDGNGVALLLVTPRVREWGEALVGFFSSTDLQDPAAVPASNGADVLYLQPPGPGVTLDQVSATIAHEYQHLVNHFAKVLNRRSSAETVWLDEGLSTFAEDLVGLGSDAFANVAAYLATVAETSLTGTGLAGEAEGGDTSARRGMAHLLVRYFFEQQGGAAFGEGPGAVLDRGGAAAVRALVQAPDTGAELFSEARTGRDFGAWVADLLTTVALDGTDHPGVSCNPRYQLAPPETSPVTGYQRGLDLRTAAPRLGGGTIPLAGPVTATLEAESVPVPVNGGEIRTLTVAAGTTELSVATVNGDYRVTLRAIPLDPAP